MLFDKIASLSKQSMVYGIGHVLARFISFLLLPFYSHYILPEEYGILILVYIFIAIAQILYIGGLDIAFLRYYVAETTDTKKLVFSIAYLGTIMVGGLLTVIIFLFPQIIISQLFHAEIPPQAVLLVRISAGILLFDTLSVIPFLCLRGDNKPFHFTALKLTNVAITIGGNIVLVAVYRLGVAGALWANLIAAAATFIMLLPVTASRFKWNMQWEKLRELWKFGLPNVPALFFLLVIEFSDRKLLEIYHGLEVAGLYSAGYKMGMFMAILTTAFRFAWQPFFLAEAKNPEAKNVFARVFTYFCLTAGFLFLAFMYFAPDFLEMKLPMLNTSILDPRYWSGMIVFPIVLLAHLFEGVYTNFTVGIYLEKKTKIVPVIIGIGAAFNLGANLLVIPAFGMMGAAWTTLGAFIIMAVTLQLYIRRFYHIAYEWGRIIKLGLMISILSGLYIIFPQLLWWRIVLIIGFPLMLFAVKFFKPTEIVRVRNLIKLSENGQNR